MKSNNRTTSISLKKLFNLTLVLTLFMAFITPGSVSAIGEAVWALSFDGENDYVKLGTTEAVFGSGWRGTKSFSMWIKPQSSGHVCEAIDVASCEQIFTNYPHFFGIAIGVHKGLDRIWVWNYDNTYNEIPISYQADEWIHITFVHAGGFLKAYRNGNLVGQVLSGDTDFQELVTPTILELGAFIRPLRTAAFQGLIDEVRIYSNELLPADISATLRTSLNGDEPGLRAYYQMSDGSGTTLTDNSDNDFNGTLMDGYDTIANGPLWVSSSAWDYPVADDQLVTTPEDTSLPITLTGSPAQGGSLQFHLVDGPAHGTLSGTIPTYTYHPALNYNGPDSISFYVTEGTLQSSLATIAIDITPVNDAPLAIPDSYELFMNNELVVVAPGILENDTDIDGDILFVDSVQYAGSGTLDISDDGSFSYIPEPGFHGTEHFGYFVSDGSVTGVSVTVTLNVIQTYYSIYIPLILK